MASTGKSLSGARSIGTKHTLASVVDNNEIDGFSVVLSVRALRDSEL